MRQRAAMKRDSIVSRFALSSLTTNEFRWLLPEAWNDDRYRQFLALRQSADAGIFRPPPVISASFARRHSPPVAVGKWLLEFNGEAASLAVEAHAFFRNFRVLSVLLAARGDNLSQREIAPLSLMISALLIMTKADVINVIPATVALGEWLSGLGFGEVRRIATPVGELFALVTPESAVFRRTTSVLVDAHAWWQTERGADDRKTLAYLEKRVELGEKMRVPAKKRQSLISRLTRFVRWS